MDKRASAKNTMSRFEINEDGQTAWLEFELDGAGWMTIWHTEVPDSLRGRGLATELVKSAFDYARANELRVDVICPIALHYLSEHPELRVLVGSGRNAG
jgi:predicted GNAT family acetyltransferase